MKLKHVNFHFRNYLINLPPLFRIACDTDNECRMFLIFIKHKYIYSIRTYNFFRSKIIEVIFSNAHKPIVVVSDRLILCTDGMDRRSLTLFAPPFPNPSLTQKYTSHAIVAFGAVGMLKLLTHKHFLK